MNLLPIGTKVYTFRDHPFMVLEGVVVEHKKVKDYHFHVCRWYDPILDHTYTEATFEPYHTKEEAEQAHTVITELIQKHFGESKTDA